MHKTYINSIYKQPIDNIVFEFPALWKYSCVTHICPLGSLEFRKLRTNTDHTRKKSHFKISSDFILFFKDNSLDFPGGRVVKNPPASAGDTDSSPGPGRSHMQWSN